VRNFLKNVKNFQENLFLLYQSIFGEMHLIKTFIWYKSI